MKVDDVIAAIHKELVAFDLAKYLKNEDAFIFDMQLRKIIISAMTGHPLPDPSYTFQKLKQPRLPEPPMGENL